MTLGYKPLYIRGMQTGLVQSREEFILPDDAYPTLENAFVWRERIKRRQGLQLLARLRRTFPLMSFFNSAPSPWGFNLFIQTGYVIAANNANPGQITTPYPHNLANGDFVWITGIVGATGYNHVAWTVTVVDDTNFTIGANAAAFGAYVSGGFWWSNAGLLSTEPNAEIEPGSVQMVINGIVFTDQGNGTLTSPTPGNSGSINYVTGSIVFITTAPGGSATSLAYNYFPGMPVMGIRSRELNTVNNEQMVVFDEKYAYKFLSGGFTELSPGTQWSGDDADFFWSTNYWVDSSNNKLFWVTNFSGTGGDPIRYFDGTTWTDFTPAINAGGDLLTQSLAILPFRGRLVVFNTLEGTSLATSVAQYQRIRWSAIGNPLASDAWKDDIRGKGGFLDIPTSESITAVGFVRDNLVIYCERSTWQLRYTGRSISPFQIEKVNSELGAYSAFSAVQFDTSLVGIGDKGIVECDSFKSERIDIKIPDLVFNSFTNENSGPQRIQGIRDLQQRLAYWIYVDQSVSEEEEGEGGGGIYPNRRLVYNYENDSWAIFTDSLTALGTFQPTSAIRWIDATYPWTEANFPWISRPALFPSLMGGNQQGFVLFLGSNITPKVTNDISLTIDGITGNTTTPTVITSPNHNMVDGQVISIADIPTGTPFAASLNGNKYGVIVVDDDNFQLWIYDPTTDEFSIPQLDAPATYIGGGKIALRDGFSIISKKFNFLDQGENIQMGYLDILTESTDEGAMTLNVFMNYNNNSPVNTLPQNVNPSGLPNPFFNTIVPTTQQSLGGMPGSKYWQRVYCPIRAAFITIQWKLSNAQLIGVEQESDVQIDSQILWQRTAGRLQTF